MKLNHISLYSHDTEADHAIFEQYFGLHTLVVRGSKMAIMQDNDGLALIVNHFENKLDGFDYPKQFDILHIGFIQKSRQDVDTLYKRLSTDGWEVQAPATTSIINPYKLTSDRHEILAYQTLTHVSTFERGSGDLARLPIAMAYRAASTGFSDPFRTKLGNQ
ncbi:VOC family protein [Acetobacter senegalensis]|uniref:VOC family protein n=1 Tax=Acetobacter senegalensis TaxID=446692 RepID=UPI001EDA34E4|nr:VOC family protein [Acetobacter senegalensis]